MKKRGGPSKVKEIENVKEEVKSEVEEVKVPQESDGNELLVGERVHTPDGEGNIIEISGDLIRVVMVNGVVNNYNKVVIKKV